MLDGGSPCAGQYLVAQASAGHWFGITVPVHVLVWFLFSHMHNVCVFVGGGGGGTASFSVFSRCLANYFFWVVDGLGVGRQSWKAPEKGFAESLGHRWKEPATCCPPLYPWCPEYP